MVSRQVLFVFFVVFLLLITTASGFARSVIVKPFVPAPLVGTFGCNVNLTGPFPQPNSTTCLPTGASVLTATANVTKLNSTTIYRGITNITNTSTELFSTARAIQDILNRTAHKGINVTISVTSPGIVYNLSSTPSTSNYTVSSPGRGSVTISFRNGTQFPGGGSATGGGSGGGCSGPFSGGSTPSGVLINCVPGVPGLLGHFIVVVSVDTDEEYYNTPTNGGQSRSVYHCIYWDPMDNQYHYSSITTDGTQINVNGNWVGVTGTISVS